MSAYPVLNGGRTSGQSIYQTSTVPKHRVGTRGVLMGGRSFYYGKAASSAALDPGKRMQAEVIPATRANLAVTAAVAVGGTSVSITLGALLAAADDYQDGMMFVNDVDGEGHAYLIKTNPAIGSGATGVFTLYDGVAVALTTNSQVTLMKNPWKDIIIGAGAATNMTVGVPCVSIPASSYGWIQTWGPAAGWDSAATAIGSGISVSATAGKFAAQGGAAAEAIFGVQLYTGVDTEYYPKFLMIAP